jgi:hypothetical protein
MEFKTFIIKENKDQAVQWGAGIALVLLTISFIIAFLKLLVVAAICFIIAVITIVVITVAKKGEIQLYGVSKQYLVLTPGSISIEGESFLVEEIRNIHIVFHS